MTYTVNLNHGNYYIMLSDSSDKHLICIAHELLRGLFGFTDIYHRTKDWVIQGHGLFQLDFAADFKAALIEIGFDELEAIHIAYCCAASTLEQQPFDRQTIIKLFNDLNPPKAASPSGSRTAPNGRKD